MLNHKWERNENAQQRISDMNFEFFSVVYFCFCTLKQREKKLQKFQIEEEKKTVLENISWFKIHIFIHQVLLRFSRWGFLTFLRSCCFSNVFLSDAFSELIQKFTFCVSFSVQDEAKEPELDYQKLPILNAGISSKKTGDTIGVPLIVCKPCLDFVV